MHGVLIWHSIVESHIAVITVSTKHVRRYEEERKRTQLRTETQQESNETHNIRDHEKQAGLHPLSSIAHLT